MTGAVDISREAVERLAERLTMGWHHAWQRDCSLAMRALRAALDAAERERDEAREDRDSHQRAAISCMQSRATEVASARREADATGYARGVREAMTMFAVHPLDLWTGEAAAAAILALLPAEKKETGDA